MKKFTIRVSCGPYAAQCDFYGTKADAMRLSDFLMFFGFAGASAMVVIDEAEDEPVREGDNQGVLKAP